MLVYIDVEILKAPTLDEDLQAINTHGEREKSVFSRDKPPDRLSNTKWLTPSTFIYETTLNGMYTHTHLDKRSQILEKMEGYESS